MVQSRLLEHPQRARAGLAFVGAGALLAAVSALAPAPLLALPTPLPARCQFAHNLTFKAGTPPQVLDTAAVSCGVIPGLGAFAIDGSVRLFIRKSGQLTGRQVGAAPLFCFACYDIGPVTLRAPIAVGDFIRSDYVITIAAPGGAFFDQADPRCLGIGTPVIKCRFRLRVRVKA